MSAQILFKKLHENAKIPTRGSVHAAGLDLYALEDGSVTQGEVVKVKTGVAAYFPKGYYGKIEARSGLAVNYGISCEAGVIDEDYTGEIIVAISRVKKDYYSFKAGDRIAQLIVQAYSPCMPVEVDEFPAETERGAGGFGSTGK